MGFLDAILLGIVEGLTEFLPISSTAHLILASRVLEIPSSDFLLSFIIAIQLGAIASIVILFWKTILWDFERMKRVAVAFIPTALIGFFLYKLLKEVLVENLALIALALLVGGVILIVFEYFHKRETATVEAEGPMPYTSALAIGLAQSLAIIPGVSRAGATILGGLLLGVPRKEIVEFSFLLAVPTMLAATGYDLLKSSAAFATGEWELLAVGFFVSFVAAYIGVRFLVRYVQTHSFAAFGYYRIALGCLVLVVVAML
ncbi:MAG: undecaprenyl-diphosphatase UppP [Patescibacteria group bacterium]